MNEHHYESEDLLQGMLAEHPTLLPGEQVDVTSPRRWLLVAREMGVAGEEGGSNRWSLDHLYLDQDAVPTLVEVKRSSDTRIRREVVGQMLDYAANAVAYWPIEALRSAFEKNCDAEGRDPEVVLAGFLEDSENIDEFWLQAKTNLQAGRIRMLFVADAIPSELRRIIEFLNQQMDPAEVLGIEIKQFQGGGVKALVPRVLGQTEAARQKKTAGSRASRTWDETSFFQVLGDEKGQEFAGVGRLIVQGVDQLGLKGRKWGKGATMGSVYPLMKLGGVVHWWFGLWTTGVVEVLFQWMKSPFDKPEKQRDLMDRLNGISGVELSEDSLGKRPSFPMAALASDGSRKQFLEVIEWAVSEVRASQ